MATPKELIARYATQAEMNSYFEDKLKIINVKSYGAKGDGSTDDYTAIFNASADADDDGAFLYFPAGTYILGTSITFPTNVSLWFSPGAVVKPSSGITVTLNGGLVDTNQQIFDGDGTISLEDSKVEFARPEWWGAIPDGSTVSDAAINKAIQAIISTTDYPSVVKFSPGRYMVSGASPIVATKNDYGALLVGSGRYATEINIQVGAAVNGITFSATSPYGRGGGIKDMRIWSPATTSSQDLVYLNNWAEWTIDNVVLDKCGRYALNLTAVLDIRINQLNAKNAAINCLAVIYDATTVPTSVTVTGSYFTLSSQVGCDVECLGLTFVGTVFESNGIGTGAEGVRVQSGTVTFDGCYWEDNQGDDVAVGYKSSQPSWGTAVTVINPFTQAGTNKNAGEGGFYVWRGDFTLIGPGTWLSSENTVIVDERYSANAKLIGLPNDLSPVPIYRDTTLFNRFQELVYSASMTPDCDKGEYFKFTANDGVAFTINAPSNPYRGAELTMLIRNTSGGALGAITWNAVFKLAAFTSPATGFSRSIKFVYDGTNWVEVNRATADVPN